LYYVDLILQHRSAMRAARGGDEEEEEEGEMEGEGEPASEDNEEFVKVNRRFSRTHSRGNSSMPSSDDNKEAMEGEGDVVYDEEEDEEDAFARSPAVQKITNILQNIGQ